MAAVRGCHSCGGRPRIDRQSIGIDVGEHRPRASHHDGQRRVRGGQGRRDDLVARSDTDPAQRNRKRIGAGADADGVFSVCRGGELLLERLELRAEDEPAPCHHSRNGFLHRFGILAGCQLQKADHLCVCAVARGKVMSSRTAERLRHGSRCMLSAGHRDGKRTIVGALETRGDRLPPESRRHRRARGLTELNP